MSTITTAQGLYDLLAADATIAAALGTYTLPDGTVRPAIGVFFANEKLPEGTISDGIEVSITALPGYATQALQEEVATNPTWRIYVVGWQSGAQLQAVAERILFLLPGATASTVPGDAPGSGIGVMDQVVVTWTNPAVAVTA